MHTNSSLWSPVGYGYFRDSTAKLARTAWAYSDFLSMKPTRSEVLLLSLDGMHASPSQVTPQRRRYPVAGQGAAVRVECLAQESNITQLPRPALEPWPLNPTSNALTFRSPRLAPSKRSRNRVNDEHKMSQPRSQGLSSSRPLDERPWERGWKCPCI